MMEKVQWNDRFNIGVEVVDKAHQKLFSIVRKMLALNEDSEKQKHACREMVKYFKNYTVKHFAEEEAYMKSIHYGGYNMHRQLHENLKNNTLPLLERELEEQDYSQESVQHFLGICIGWLTGHIMIEDRAITGGRSNKWVYNPAEEEISALEKATAEVMKEVFGVKPWLVSARYGGEDFGKGIFFRLTYRTKKDEKIRVFLGYEEQLILYMLSEMLGKTLRRVDNTVVYAVRQLSKQLVKRIGVLYEPLDVHRLEKDDLITYDQLLRSFEKAYPHYSLLYGTEGNGYFAFCVKK